MLLTRLPLTPKGSFDLHVLGTPPAFVLSQDQTLHTKSSALWPNICKESISALLNVDNLTCPCFEPRFAPRFRALTQALLVNKIAYSLVKNGLLRPVLSGARPERQEIISLARVKVKRKNKISWGTVRTRHYMRRQHTRSLADGNHPPVAAGLQLERHTITLHDAAHHSKQYWTARTRHYKRRQHTRSSAEGNHFPVAAELQQLARFAIISITATTHRGNLKYKSAGLLRRLLEPKLVS